MFLTRHKFLVTQPNISNKNNKDGTMFPLLIVLSSDMFHFLTIVKLPRESIVKTRSNTEAVCNTFLGTATDSNCCRVWLKDDSRVHILLTTDIGPLKLFNFLTHSLKVYCVARKDPRTNFVEKPGSTTRSGRSMISSYGGEQPRGHYPVCPL